MTTAELSMSVDPLDVSRSELYSTGDWSTPFRTLRAQAPVHYVEDSKFGPYWSVSAYQPIVDIELNTEVFSSSWEYGGITIGFRPEKRLKGEIRMPMFIAMDPPRHTAQRKTVARAFGPAEVAAMKDEVRRRTSAVLDSLPVGTPFDWVERVSIELSTGMLAKLFDFPWEERGKLTAWSDTGSDIELLLKPGGAERRNEVIFEMSAAFAKLWRQKTEEPGKDLISIMLQSDAMSNMSYAEFLGNLILLIVGGNDTTRNSMSAYAYGLHLFPQERARLEADPSLIPNAVQELIRWQTPLAHMRRTATRDFDIEGRTIKQGDVVALWYISANRDETVFDDADSIRADRGNARRHLAYGSGIHRCVGARVADMQLGVLLEEMARRRLRVNVVAAPERTPSCFVHGYRKMPVELSAY